jgi:proteasome lid subunit RPN8/RPN11
VKLEVERTDAKLPAGVVQAMIQHARDKAPLECCGLLVGVGDEVVEAVPARNLASQPATRFLLDPKDHIDTRRAARARGLNVIGFYHSHPRTPAFPSERDLAEASYADAFCAIISLASEPPEVRVFRLSTFNAATAESAE